MPSGRLPTLIRVRCLSVFSSNEVTVESPPLLVKPRPSFEAIATPCTPGVFGISPIMAALSTSNSITRSDRAI